MAGSSKVIITCALTGSGHTPSMSPYLPYTVEQVVDQGVAAAEAGAAVLHLHARDPQDGSPTADPAVFAEYARGIRQRSDVVISISTGGGTGMTVEDRLQGVLKLKPELCTLNLGTMNYGSFPMIDRYRDKFRFAWEEPYLESTRAEPFVSTYADIEYMLKVVGPQTGTRFEAEAYDTSHLYTLAYYLDQGLVQPPVFVQTIFGTMGGIGPDVDHIVHMKRTADRLLGDAYQWSTLGAGRYQMGIVTAAAIMGSHVRVGLEDSLYLGKGQIAESNADQVRKIRGILEALSLEIATPAEARQMLGLKGLDHVGYDGRPGAPAPAQEAHEGLTGVVFDSGGDRLVGSSTWPAAACRSPRSCCCTAARGWSRTSTSRRGCGTAAGTRSCSTTAGAGAAVGATTCAPSRVT